MSAALAAPPASSTRARHRTEREQVLLDGLQAAAEEIRYLRSVIATLTRVVVLHACLAGLERDRARRWAPELGRRLAEACRRETSWERTAQLAADRMVLAEHRVEQARAALPELERAAHGTSRPAVLAAIEALRAALGADQ